MKEEFVKNIFSVAELYPIKMWKLTNQYWPSHTDYDEIRSNNPWWLVKTEFGLIEIGRRKRVWEINWSDTPYRGKLTSDDVTNFDYFVHAYTEPKILEYLMTLSSELRKIK